MTTSTPTHDVPTDGIPVPTRTLRQRLVLFTLSAVVFAFSLMQTLVVPALPTLGADLGAGSQGTGWIITAFLLAGAVFAPVIGNVGDRFGHRRVLIIVVVIFALATVGAAAAPNLAVLLTARVLQGISTATFPLALALARTLLTGPRLAAAFGWIPGMIGLGAGIALVIGGVIVDALSWRWLFIIGALLIAATAAMLLAWVPGGAAPAVRRRTDWAGIALLAGGLVCLLLAVSQGASWGWASAATLGTGGAGLVLLAALVIVELRIASPVVDVRTFRHGSLALVSALTVAIGFVPYICYVALPPFLQAPLDTGYGQGMSVTLSALVMLPSAVFVFVGGRMTPVLVARCGAGMTGLIAAVTMAIGGAGLALWTTSPWLVTLSFSVLGLGNGIGYAVCAQLVMLFSPASETGAATGLNSVVRTVGSSAAAPVVAAVLAASAEPTLGYAAVFWVGVAASLLGAAASVALVVKGRSHSA